MHYFNITFARFLLFSVMPCDCIVEIEIDGVFGHAELIETRTSPRKKQKTHWSSSRTKVRGNGDDLRFRDDNENM